MKPNPYTVNRTPFTIKFISLLVVETFLFSSILPAWALEIDHSHLRPHASDGANRNDLFEELQQKQQTEDAKDGGREGTWHDFIVGKTHFFPPLHSWRDLVLYDGDIHGPFEFTETDIKLPNVLSKLREEGVHLERLHGGVGLIIGPSTRPDELITALENLGLREVHAIDWRKDRLEILATRLNQRYPLGHPQRNAFKLHHAHAARLREAGIQEGSIDFVYTAGVFDSYPVGKILEGMVTEVRKVLSPSGVAVFARSGSVQKYFKPSELFESTILADRHLESLLVFQKAHLDDGAARDGGRRGASRQKMSDLVIEDIDSAIAVFRKNLRKSSRPGDIREAQEAIQWLTHTKQEIVRKGLYQVLHAASRPLSKNLLKQIKLFEMVASELLGRPIRVDRSHILVIPKTAPWFKYLWTRTGIEAFHWGNPTYPSERGFVVLIYPDGIKPEFEFMPKSIRHSKTKQVENLFHELWHLVGITQWRFQERPFLKEPFFEEGVIEYLTYLTLQRIGISYRPAYPMNFYFVKALSQRLAHHHRTRARILFEMFQTGNIKPIRKALSPRTSLFEDLLVKISSPSLQRSWHSVEYLPFLILEDSHFDREEYRALQEIFRIIQKLERQTQKAFFDKVPPYDKTPSRLVNPMTWAGYWLVANWAALKPNVVTKLTKQLSRGKVTHLQVEESLSRRIDKVGRSYRPLDASPGNQKARDGGEHDITNRVEAVVKRALDAEGIKEWPRGRSAYDLRRSTLLAQRVAQALEREFGIPFGWEAFNKAQSPDELAAVAQLIIERKRGDAARDGGAQYWDETPYEIAHATLGPLYGLIAQMDRALSEVPEENEERFTDERKSKLKEMSEQITAEIVRLGQLPEVRTAIAYPRLEKKAGEFTLDIDALTAVQAPSAERMAYVRATLHGLTESAGPLEDHLIVMHLAKIIRQETRGRKKLGIGGEWDFEKLIGLPEDENLDRPPFMSHDRRKADFVSTALRAAGYSVVKGEWVLVADDPEETARDGGEKVLEELKYRLELRGSVAKNGIYFIIDDKPRYFMSSKHQFFKVAKSPDGKEVLEPITDDHLKALLSMFPTIVENTLLHHPPQWLQQVPSGSSVFMVPSISVSLHYTSDAVLFSLNDKQIYRIERRDLSKVTRIRDGQFPGKEIAGEVLLLAFAPFYFDGTLYSAIQKKDRNTLFVTLPSELRGASGGGAVRDGGERFSEGLVMELEKILWPGRDPHFLTPREFADLLVKEMGQKITSERKGVIFFLTTLERAAQSDNPLRRETAKEILQALEPYLSQGLKAQVEGLHSAPQVPPTAVPQAIPSAPRDLLTQARRLVESPQPDAVQLERMRDRLRREMGGGAIRRSDAAEVLFQISEKLEALRAERNRPAKIALTIDALNVYLAAMEKELGFGHATSAKASLGRAEKELEELRKLDPNHPEIAPSQAKIESLKSRTTASVEEARQALRRETKAPRPTPSPMTERDREAKRLAMEIEDVVEEFFGERKGLGRGTDPAESLERAAKMGEALIALRQTGWFPHESIRVSVTRSLSKLGYALNRIHLRHRTYSERMRLIQAVYEASLAFRPSWYNPTQRLRDEASLARVKEALGTPGDAARDGGLRRIELPEAERQEIPRPSLQHELLVSP